MWEPVSMGYNVGEISKNTLLHSLYCVDISDELYFLSYFLPKEARPYSTPVAKAMAFPNKVVKEKLKNTGNRAILRTGKVIESD